jgi:hypothetical protein
MRGSPEHSCSRDFPSAERPVLDRSTFAGAPDAPVSQRLEVFAADSVAAVELATVGG